MKKLLTVVLLSISFSASAEVIKAKVEGLVCAFCGSAIEKKLRNNAATEDVLVSLEHKIVAISLKPGQQLSDAELKAQIVDAGYDVKSIERTQESLAAVRAALKARAD